MHESESPATHVVPGFRTAGVACGLKKQEGALDFALTVADGPCSAAAVFTTNRVKAAPVLYDQAIMALHAHRLRAVVINSGCANACTGPEGLEDARQTARLVASAVGCAPEQVFVMSTGVIGQRLKMDRIATGVERGAQALAADGWERTAQAIMTTDTRPKLRFRTAAQGGQTLSLVGMAKGAGMIHPNMATMLSQVCTDAHIAPALLQQALRDVVGDTFNAITVDGDTSTNDTLLVLASGQGPQVSEEDGTYGVFVTALRDLCGELAREIVRDGEGATRFISILVRGATDAAAARQVAKAIAHSPLVKTAIYGADANWGRVLCAAGYSGVAIEPDRASLWFSRGQYLDGAQPYPPGADRTPEPVTDAPLHVHLVRDGRPYRVDEARALDILQDKDVAITLDLGMGEAAALVWTCDFSHDYVSINGHYRT